MNALLRMGLVLAALSTGTIGTEATHVSVLRDPEMLHLFGGREQPVRVVFRNPTDQTLRIGVQAQVYQLNSATAVRSGTSRWQPLQMFAGQTVIETGSISFPEVKARTRFALRWVDSLKRTLGTTDVWVYPDDLLSGLKPLAGSEPLGVFDPDDELKPLLRRVAVDFEDMERSGLDRFTGDLAIVGPFASPARERETLRAAILHLAKRGTAVVWIRPPQDAVELLQPSFVSIPIGKGTVVVVAGGLVSGLKVEPRSQLHLVELARQALQPVPVGLLN